MRRLFVHNSNSFVNYTKLLNPCLLLRIVITKFSTLAHFLASSFFVLVIAFREYTCMIGFTNIWFLPRCMECRRGLAMRIPSVCLSVRPSVRQMRELWQNGRKICLDFYTIRKIIYPSFLREKNCRWGATPSTEILGQPVRVGAKSPILNR